MFLSYLRRKRALLTPRRVTPRPPRVKVRPRCEELEPRCVPATITVNDTGDANARDNVLTLREALMVDSGTLAVNALTAAEQAQVVGNPVTDAINTIQFNIGNGAQVIAPTAALPSIDHRTTLDGTAPAGFATQDIKIDGTNLNGFTGLWVNSDDSIIRKLTLYNWTGGDGSEAAAIRLQVNVLNGKGGNRTKIEGCIIGTDKDSKSGLNNKYGIFISYGANNTIGGNTDAQRNVISGNSVGVYIQSWRAVSPPILATGNKIIGNYIGTNVTGDGTLANPGVFPYSNSTGVRIDDSPQNTVGGTADGERNVISNNGFGAGVDLTGAGATANVVGGNYIGLKKNGKDELGNSYGVLIENSATNNTVGGTAPTDGNGVITAPVNVISANKTGIKIKANGNVVTGNFIGTIADGTTWVAIADKTSMFAGVFIDGANKNTIGGATAGTRNIISGNWKDPTTNWGAGVALWGAASQNQIIGNYIGTDKTGLNAVPNDGNGVEILGGWDNSVGGAAVAARNVISANLRNGVYIFQANRTKVWQTFIGTDKNGKANLPNKVKGVDNTQGIGTTLSLNAIGGNGTGGVLLAADTGTVMDSNLVFANLGDGVDMQGSVNALLTNNLIGSDGTGAALGNEGNGVTVEAATQAAVLQNNTVVSNTGYGVLITGNGTVNTNLYGNDIGTDAALTPGEGNLDTGVVIADYADTTTLTGSNEIDNNGGSGLAMDSLNTLTMSGTTDISNNAVFGILFDLGMVWMPGVTTVNGSYQQGATHVNLQAGQLTVNGSWLDIDGTFNVGQGTLTTPTVQINDEGIVCGAGTIVGSVSMLGQVYAGANGQPLHVTGSYTTTPGGDTHIGTGWSWDGAPAYALVVDGDMTQDYGFVLISSGSLTARSLSTQDNSYVALLNGTITTTYGFVLGSSCTFDANGTVNGDLENDGTINVGGPNALGVLNVNGNYTQTGTVNIELTTSGYDQLNVSGVANLGGYMNVTELGSIPPPYSATVMTWGSYSGAFASVSVPPGFFWAYGPTGFVVWE
jgi:hypothetical protein